MTSVNNLKGKIDKIKPDTQEESTDIEIGKKKTDKIVQVYYVLAQSGVRTNRDALITELILIL